MKTITYRGEQYEVEDWVNWVAMESNGTYYGYENEPYLNLGSGEWIKDVGRICIIGEENMEWEESLEKV